jgi:hypothetical protein
MKTIGMIVILIVGSGLAQQPGVNRTDLQPSLSKTAFGKARFGQAENYCGLA